MNGLKVLKLLLLKKLQEMLECVNNDLETKLIKAIIQDDKSQLFSLSTTSNNTSPISISKLLHLCCSFDSVNCATSLVNGSPTSVNEVDASGTSPLHAAAEAHASRCVEMLLRKRARTDLKTRDGHGLLPLELSLYRTRMDVIWDPDNHSIEELLVQLNEKDLTTIQLLSEKTKEIDDVAYACAVGGRVVDLAALLVVAPQKMNELILELHDADSNSKLKTTIYQCAGDEAIIELLLKTNIDINDVDAEGNSALHWCLRTSKGSCSKQIKFFLFLPPSIMWLLLKHGAQVSQKNKLGLTAVHIASGNGNTQALKILLLEDPDSVNSKTETKETPLFFAVKNDCKDCAELLLHWGASTEVFNLRYKTIEEAKSRQISWVDTLVSGQPKVDLNKSKIHKENIPKWLRTFKKWLPDFLQQVAKRDGEYALSSLKADFRSAFGLELDHASLGFSKLSDFMRSFPDLCRIMFVAIGRHKPANHMILLPNLPKSHSQRLQPLKMPRASSSDGKSEDAKGFQDQDVPLVSNKNDHLTDCSSKLPHQMPQENPGDTDKSTFLQFLKTDLIFHARSWLFGECDRSTDAVEGEEQMETFKGPRARPQERHMVLEALARKRKSSSVFFLREFDFYFKHRASVVQSRCFGCNRRTVLWANFPCQHLLWCANCRLEIILAASGFEHKCVVCDIIVQKIGLISPTEYHQPHVTEPRSINSLL
ncbi:ankyrin repeat-containing protein, putative [Ricinus communis]|uniref:Ankyrin repeat-containing protein, putative n=1 Tax=Ricinus communis TaxID=3988 RepID=B9SEF0_RICCO|nr:ankyrin repeat-containing protein, putative [Ricinus communis]